VQDPDFHGEPPPGRFAEVAEALVSSLHGEFHAPPTFRRTWSGQRESGSLMALPTRVRIDNATSDSCTILDVFAHDRPGLLYAVTKTLFEQRLSVRMAKIGTYLDQVVDVFYLTDLQGEKIEDGCRLAEIRASLLEAIEVWTEDNSAPFAPD
jgi:[protein-PII] uridylyltransferase